MTERTQRRYSFVEEWSPGNKVEIIITGPVEAPQLDAIEGYARRMRERLDHRDGDRENMFALDALSFVIGAGAAGVMRIKKYSVPTFARLRGHNPARALAL